MAQDSMNNDRVYRGAVSFAGTVSLPSSSVSNTNIVAGSSGNRITADKVVHQQVKSGELYGPTTTIAALTKDGVHRAYGSGTLVEFAAWIQVAADDASRTVTVDLQKSTSGGAYATVLSSTIGFTNASTVRVALTGTISSTSYVAGDTFRVVVSVAGGSGNQATGLSYALTLTENPA